MSFGGPFDALGPVANFVLGGQAEPFDWDRKRMIDDQMRVFSGSRASERLTEVERLQWASESEKIAERIIAERNR